MNRVLRKLISLLVLISSQAIALACPNCKDALATEAAKSLALGYYWSILVMVSLPFLLSGFIAFIIIRAYRLKKNSELSKGENLEQNRISS